MQNRKIVRDTKERIEILKYICKWAVYTELKTQFKINGEPAELQDIAMAENMLKINQSFLMIDDMIIQGNVPGTFRGNTECFELQAHDTKYTFTIDSLKASFFQLLECQRTEQKQKEALEVSPLLFQKDLEINKRYLRSITMYVSGKPVFEADELRLLDISEEWKSFRLTFAKFSLSVPYSDIYRKVNENSVLYLLEDNLHNITVIEYTRKKGHIWNI